MDGICWVKLSADKICILNQYRNKKYTYIFTYFFFIKANIIDDIISDVVIYLFSVELWFPFICLLTSPSSLSICFSPLFFCLMLYPRRHSSPLLSSSFSQLLCSPVISKLPSPPLFSCLNLPLQMSPLYSPGLPAILISGISSILRFSLLPGKKQDDLLPRWHSVSK